MRDGESEGEGDGGRESGNAAMRDCAVRDTVGASTHSYSCR